MKPIPQRIQRRRTMGWRMPEGAIYVGRPSKWGNPVRVGGMVYCESAGRAWSRPITADDAVSFFEVDLRCGFLRFRIEDIRRELRGHDLVCWCPLASPCHADVLLELANA